MKIDHLVQLVTSCHNPNKSIEINIQHFEEYLKFITSNADCSKDEQPCQELKPITPQRSKKT